MAYLQMDIRSQGSIAATQSQTNDALREAFRWIGESWHKRYKMIKFRNSASRKYGLTPRMGESGSGRPFKGSYSQAKVLRKSNGQGVRAIGENKPFVWSGTSRANAAASTKVVARAKRGIGSADCIINAPTLNFRPKNGRINLREEFERVTEEERRALEREAIVIYELLLNRTPGSQVRISA